MIRHAAVDGPRPVTPAEFADTVALCNRVLRPHGPPTIAEEYPRVFAPANAGHMWIIKSDGRVVSHAATYAGTVVLDDATTLQLGGISSVATEPSVRKRGYASRLVEACCDDLRAQGCHFAVLWTEIKGFYEKLDFASLGSELLYRLTPPDVRGILVDADISVFMAEDLPAVMALREGTAPFMRRSRDEWLAYLNIPKCTVWVARRGETCVAYLVMGKGEDFRNCVHEWAGEESAVLALLAHVTAQSTRRELIFLTPDAVGPVHGELRRLKVPFIQIDLGMFRCLDPVGTFAALAPFLESRLGVPVRLEAAGARWKLHVGEDVTSPMTTETLAALLLGPRRARELLPASSPGTEALEQALPLPFFIWGLDSV